MSGTRIDGFARLIVVAIFFAILGRPVAAAPELARITLGGFMKQEVGVSDSTGASAGALSDLAQQSDNEIHLKFRATLDNGIVLNGRWELEGTPASDHIDEQWLRISGAFGRVVIGEDNTVAHGMPPQPPAVGLSITDADDWVVNTTGASGGGDSPFEDYALRMEANDPEMISYFAPRIAGLALGVSYIPDAIQHEDEASKSRGSVYENGVALGLNYRRDLGAVRLTLGAGYQTWLDWPDSDAGRPEGFVVGLELRHGGLRLGAATIAIDDTFDGGGAETADSQDGAGYRLGLGYAWAANEASLTWHHGTDENDPANPAKAQNDTLMASLRRTVAPGVRLYGTLLVVDFEGEAAGASDDNKGWGLVSGLRLDF